MAEKLLVMRPFMPPMQEFQPYLDRIWKSRQLTNNGPFHAELENALCEYLGLSIFACLPMAHLL